MVLFCGFAAMYAFTVQRGICWQDSGARQWRIITGDYAGQLGLALSHPLYIALGRLFLRVPFADAATRLNLLSGAAMAVALANISALTAVLSGKRWIGIATAAMLSVMHTVWWLATITEVYTLNAALLSAELLMLVRLIRRPATQTAAALFFLSGLDLCVHNLAILPLPVYAGVVLVLLKRKQLRFSALVFSACSYIAGSAMYAAMIADVALKSGSASGALHSALFGRYASEVLGTVPVWRFFKVNAGLVCLNFASFFLPLSVAGWLCMRRRLGGLLTAALAGITLIEIVFSLRYPVPDQFMFILPSLIMAALAASIGIAGFAGRSRRWRGWVMAACVVSIAMPPVLYSGLPDLVRAAGLEVKRKRVRPYRDEIRYWGVPWKHNERSAEQFADAALKQAMPNGLIICDNTAFYPLVLKQHLDRKAPGVTIRKYGALLAKGRAGPQWLEDTLRARPVFVIRALVGMVPPEKVCKHESVGSDAPVLVRLKGKDQQQME